MPKRNLDDLDELPKDIRESLTLVPVERIDQVLETAIRKPEPPPAKRKRRAGDEPAAVQLPN